MKKLIKNYTTTVPAEKSLQEIQTLLANNGATGIAFDYKDGQVTSIFFKINYNNQVLPFRLPVNPQKVYRALFGDLVGQNNQAWVIQRRSKANNIAFRICKDWLEAQLTHVNLEQAQIQEVFLPYLVTGENQTLYEKLEASQFLLKGGE